MKTKRHSPYHAYVLYLCPQHIMDHHSCKNCGQPVSLNYCPNCGQKAHTHRFSLKHLFAHDLVHGVFHLDKGFLFTARELLVRPGYSIREYVEGKRVRHFNFATFILLLAAVNIFITTTFNFNFSSIAGASADLSNDYLLFMQKHIKEFYLLLIPINALFSFLFFRKARQNYAEHLVMNAYKEGGALMINTAMLLIISIFGRDLKTLVTLSMCAVFVTLLYSIRFYRQYFEKDYSSKLALTLRVWLVLSLPPLAGMAVILLIRALALGHIL